MSEMRRLLPAARRQSTDMGPHSPNQDASLCSASSLTRFHLLVIAAFVLMVFMAGPLMQVAQVDHSSRPLDCSIARGQKITLPAPPYPSVNHERPSHQITKPFHAHAGDVARVQPTVARPGVYSRASPSDFGVTAEGSGSVVRSAAMFVVVLFVIGGVWRQRQAAPEPLLGVATVPVPIRLRPTRAHGPAAQPVRAQAPGGPTNGSRPHPPPPPGGGVVGQLYEAMVTSIIRPPRAEYAVEELGPAQFTMDGQKFGRRDFTVVNRRGHSLCCSLWVPLAAPGPLATVVYLHGNASCRVEAMELLPHCLLRGLAVAALDFAGCGRSEGPYISLGHFEAEDLVAVVDALRQQPEVGRLVLWGRSMGAVTALLYAAASGSGSPEAAAGGAAAAERPGLAGVVADSAFSSFAELAQELVRGGQVLPVPMPGWLVSVGLWLIGRTVQQRAGFDLGRLSPVTAVPAARVPCLFAHAVEDSLVPAEHSRRLFHSYGGPKRLAVFPGDHNTLRPLAFLAAAAEFAAAATHGDPDALSAVQPPAGQRPQFEVLLP
eukprot:EG_transcript_3814